MRKLQLTLENLEVESFATTQDDGAERGTVRGHDSQSDPSGIGCASLGCDSVSGIEWCICEQKIHTGNQQTCAS